MNEDEETAVKIQTGKTLKTILVSVKNSVKNTCKAAFWVTGAIAILAWIVLPALFVISVTGDPTGREGAWLGQMIVYTPLYYYLFGKTGVRALQGLKNRLFG